MSGEDKKTSGKSELRGAPLDVVRELLGEGRTEDVRPASVYWTDSDAGTMMKVPIDGGSP